MSAVLKASLIYMFGALAVTALLSADMIGSVQTLLGAAMAFSYKMADFLAHIWPVIPLALFLLGPKRLLSRLVPVLSVTGAVLFLQIGFLFAKSAIPQLIPFYADPMLADFDRLLLVGHDAWQLAHAMTPEALTSIFTTAYMPLWLLVATVFPIVVVSTDPDETRMMRYVWLFFASWFVVGNVAATLGSSVGPIYYDRLLGTARYEDLHAALAQSGFADSAIGQIQTRLWNASVNAGGVHISGISAFPSVHVAVATILALYLAERFRFGAPVGYAFLALIGLISVYSGYHYLSDSLVSVVMIVAMNHLLKRREGRSEVFTETDVECPGSATPAE
ncbi:phosphatase PAP2 family protein [Maritimibacter dapengensis]|uniref:Phosphatase PAP2 family protein n=1 Tax=Maritimibacter dapengensis TaxID=2836868 RepID=A0ABS6SYY2_9RHOB|nr:phosphatase PAP2 family protein [Maritimibacter dapengensis]MBV7378186.1 phosphatase PAP2 family protein [Maritimibacter dapengensis]